MKGTLSSRAMFIDGFSKRLDRKKGFNRSEAKRLQQREANIRRAGKLAKAAQ